MIRAVRRFARAVLVTSGVELLRPAAVGGDGSVSLTKRGLAQVDLVLADRNVLLDLPFDLIYECLSDAPCDLSAANLFDAEVEAKVTMIAIDRCGRAGVECFDEPSEPHDTHAETMGPSNSASERGRFQVPGR